MHRASEEERMTSMRVSTWYNSIPKHGMTLFYLLSTQLVRVYVSELTVYFAVNSPCLAVLILP